MLSIKSHLLLTSILAFFFINCKTHLTSPKKPALSKLRLIITTDQKIDTIVIAKIGGFTPKDIFHFQDTITVTSTNPFDDNFQIGYFQKNIFSGDYIWLKGSDIIVNATISSTLKIDTVINSPFYYYTKDIYDKYYALLDKNSESGIINEFLLSEIKNNLNHPFSNELAFDYIHQNKNNFNSLRKLNELIKNQQEYIKNHFLGVHRILENMIDIQSVNLPDYLFYNENGEKNTLKTNSDQLYLLDFWFIACKPCIEDHKILKKKIDELKENNTNIIGISIDGNQEAWASFLNKNNYEWDNYRETKIEDTNQLSSDLGISVYPTYVIINDSGKILFRNDSIDKTLGYLVNQ